MTLATSITAFEADLENFVAETESDVQAVIAAIGKGAALLEATLDSALKWVASEVPTVVPLIEEALGFATEVGAAANPEAAAIIAGAQTAIAALNAVAQAQGTGASDIQTLLAGYTAVKTAQSTAASVTAASTKAVAASPTATTSAS